jgi:p-methyltransferase
MELLNIVRQRAFNTPSALNAFHLPSLGVHYLVNYLWRRGIGADAVNCFSAEKPRLLNLLSANPLCVAITTTYYVEDDPIREVIQFVRNANAATRIIVGGPRIYALAKGQSERVAALAFKAIGADIYIESPQGEKTLAATIDAIENKRDLRPIANLSFFDEQGQMVRTLRETEENPLAANSIEWSRFSESTVTPVNYMRTARSCPFACEFCNYPAMAGQHTYMSVEEIENELKRMSAIGIRDIIFIDDTFNVPFGRFKNICRMIIRNKFRFRWISFFRCSSCDDEALMLMRDSGCLAVYLGVESGDAQVLKNMRKFGDVEKYVERIKRLDEHGILTLASMIIGFPGETEESVRRSIEFLNRAKPHFYNVQTYYHDLQAPIASREGPLHVTGAGYNWSHASMDWREAVRLKRVMIRDVRPSLQLPLYGFSIWSFPYLLSSGMTLNQVLRFTRYANDLSHAEILGRPFDIDAEMSAVVESFRSQQLRVQVAASAP